MKDDPAFPSRWEKCEVTTEGHLFTPLDKGGLTKREYFAAAAMQGILAKVALFEDLKGKTVRASPKSVAKAAVEFADALIKELRKK